MIYLNAARPTRTVSFFVLALCAFLGACSAVPGADPVAEQLRATAEGINDDLMEAALVHLCYGATVGAVRREFGASPDRSTLYHELCQTPGPVLPIEGEGQ